MKAKPVVTISLAVILCGGLLLAFPTLWMFLLLVLLGLVSLQMSIIRKHLHVIGRDAAGQGFSISAAPVMHAPPPTAPQPVHDVSAVLNRELFSRFRQHLETAEAPVATAPKPAAPVAASPPPVAPKAVPTPAKPQATPAPAAVAEHLQVDGVADRVAISGSGKGSIPKLKPRPAYPPDPRPKAPPVKEAESDVDWFADLRPNPLGAQGSKVAVPPPPPAPSQEVATPVAGQDEEASTLIKLAEDGLQRGDIPAAKAALGHYLSLMNAHGSNIPWTARRVQSRVAVMDQDAAAATEAFDAMLKDGYEVKEEAIPALLDQMIAGAKPEIAEQLRVSMLLRILAVFRQGKDRGAMDRLYRMIEEAQEKVGDERKLVQFLKNHLEIKRVMGEAAGQVDLIDQIGNRLFKLGETAAAREYYEMGLKLRAELQQQQPAQPATEPKTGTTQTA
ncbi:MAG TPA: hypothetical protein VF678_09425 [bacterium]